MNFRRKYSNYEPLPLSQWDLLRRDEGGEASGREDQDAPGTRNIPCTPRPVHARVLGHGLYDSTARVLGHDSLAQKSVPGNIDLFGSIFGFYSYCN